MQLLQTIVPCPETNIHISHKDNILLIGSCFTEHIGKLLSASGFNVRINPFGILYNPISIAQCLQYCLEDQEIDAQSIVEYNGLFHSWLHHSSFSRATAQECMDACNQVIHETHQFLSDDATIILTLGTAWAYTLRGGQIVANCHKLPASHFTKKMLSIEEIKQAFAPLINKLMISSTKQLIATVSPIRHWADTPHGNQLSKSTLLLALDSIKWWRYSYFPTYEIMMDELRDYRFYSRDMLHPNDLAIDLIWDKFSSTYFDKKTQNIAQKFLQYHAMEGHRPMHPEGKEYAIFLTKKEQLWEEIQQMLQR